MVAAGLPAGAVVAETIVAEPVALVIDVDGGSAAGIEPFSEIADGRSLTLGDRGRLTFVHYRRCEEVVVENGTITFSADWYRLVGGAIVGSRSRPCPNTSTSTSGLVGGVVFRGSPILAVSPDPVFVIVGPKSGSVARLRISDGDEPLAEAEVTLPAVNWSAGWYRLRPGQAYDVELLSASGDAVQSVHIIAREQEARSVLLHVE